MANELTPQEKIFVEHYIETGSALEAAKKAYPTSKFRSQQAMSLQILQRPRVQEAIVMKRGVGDVFSKEYLLMKLRSIIEDPKGNGAARVSAIKIAGELLGYLQREPAGKLRPKSLAEELGESTPLRELAARAAEYQQEKTS